MIRIERPPAPDVLQGDIANRALAKAGEFFQTDTRSVRQRRFDFEAAGLLQSPETVEALNLAFGQRCAFCMRSSARVELFAHRLRPPQDAVGTDGETSRRHYWWLAYEWGNLYLACEPCRISQGAKFPVSEDRVRVGSTRNLASEGPLLIDPCAEDPEPLLLYLDNGSVVSEDPRGKATIEVFDLNRPELERERREAAMITRGEIEVAADLLRSGEFGDLLTYLSKLFSVEAPLASLRRQLVNQWAQVRPRKIDEALLHASEGEVDLTTLTGSLRRITGKVKTEARNEFFGVRPSELDEPVRRAMADWRPESPSPYFDVAEIQRIEIENFRGIENLVLDFGEGVADGSWLMLLGENGAGKSSVLQAIALTLCGPDVLERVPVDPSEFLRFGTKQGLVRVELTGGRMERELRFDKHRLDAFGAPREGVLIAGYGATRLLPDRNSRSPAGSRVGALFDPLIRLVQPKAWLATLSSEHFDAVARTLRGLLRLDESEEIRRSPDGLQIVRRHTHLPLSALSEGYRAMAALALDMMEFFLGRWGSLEAAEGIVLIDEIGAHLHPRWQMQVTTTLRKAFPRVQFIATTHDPLCLRGLGDGEVAVLGLDSKRRTYSIQEGLPSVEGMAVDQLLTSEHFGLSSTRDPDLEKRFERYYELLAERERTSGEEDELGELREELARFKLLGVTLRERLGLEAVDELLASQRHSAGGVDIAKLRDDTRMEINRIWSEATIT